MEPQRGLLESLYYSSYSFYRNKILIPDYTSNKTAKSLQESISYPAQLRQIFFFYLINHKAQLFPYSDESLHEWTKNQFKRLIGRDIWYTHSWRSLDLDAAVVVHVCRSSRHRTCPALRLQQPEYLLVFSQLIVLKALTGVLLYDPSDERALPFSPVNVVRAAFLLIKPSSYLG